MLKRTSSQTIDSEHDISEITHTSPQELLNIIENIEKHYSSFMRKKKGGGLRKITPPRKKLKRIQRLAKWHIDKQIQLPGYLHGGIAKRSSLTNARVHVGKSMVANIDIRNYFPSINFEMVVNTLISVGYDYETSWLMAKLLTFRNMLPQGSPTSMLLSNLVFSSADERFMSFCKRRGLSYTRYVDDITVSGNMDLRPFKGAFFPFVEKAGFEVTVDKVRFCGRNEPQIVTGLVVNDKIRPTKKYIHQLKKDIRSAWPDELGVEVAASIHGFSVNHFFHNLWGRIHFLKSIDTELGKKVARLIFTIDWRAHSS